MIVSKLLNDRAIQTQKPISVRYFFQYVKVFPQILVKRNTVCCTLAKFQWIKNNRKARAFCILYLLGVDRLYLSPAGQVLQVRVIETFINPKPHTVTGSAKRMPPRLLTSEKSCLQVLGANANMCVNITYRPRQ